MARYFLNTSPFLMNIMFIYVINMFTLLVIYKNVQIYIFRLGTLPFMPHAIITYFKDETGGMGSDIF